MKTESVTVTAASRERAKRFVDWFVRSDDVSALTAERDSDFYNEPDRAERVARASESGAYGATHAEIIEDWRDAFTSFLRDRRGRNDVERFERAVSACFDEIEAWHDKNGSLYDEIG